MGLDKLRNECGLAFLSPASGWLVPLGISLSSLAIALGGDAGREVFRYQREAIADGEFWRLFSGHLAHLGISHLLLNIAGLLLIWLLVGHRFRNIQWIAIVLICVAGIDPLEVGQVSLLIAHEFGHVLGLGHCLDCDSAMNYSWATRGRIYVTELDIRTFLALVAQTNSF